MITEKIDAVTKIPATHLHEEIPAPKSVKIELSPRCNYRCGFCALRTRENQPTKDMDFALFQRITTQMYQAGVEEIGMFYLGESMMNVPLLAKAIKWCKDLGFPYTFLTTNGSLATKGAVKQIMQAGLDSLKFSVNMFSEDQFKEIVDVAPKLYWKSLENIKGAWEVRQEGYDTKIYASSIKFDGVQDEAMEAVLNEYVRPYVDQHYWLPLYSMGAFATDREEELGYKPIAGNQGRIGALREPLPCWSVFTEGHVTAEGLLSACCFDANKNWIMGDLKKDTFMDAWNSPEFLALRAAHLSKNVSGTICEDCVAYK